MNAGDTVPKLGAKGMRTRRRIMDATLKLLREQPYPDLKITDIAREADIAQPNFYTYFTSLEDVIAALAEVVTASHLADHIRQDWSGPDGDVHARALVEAGIPLWRDYRALFAIIAMLADRQHGRFPDLRVHQTRDVYRAFQAQIRAAQAGGHLPAAVDPQIGSYQCLACLSATCDKYDLLRASGFSHETLVRSTATMLRVMATGR